MKEILKQNESKNLNENKEIENTKIDYDKIIKSVVNSEKYNSLKYLENSKEILNNLALEIKKLFVFIENQQQNSEFKLKKAEFAFCFQEKDVKFKGFVDRIDETQDEFIVIDYKTGATKIEYKDIVFCKKIQLILYAKILEQILNKKCAGIYYLSLSDDFSTEEKPKIYLNGITKNTNNNLFRLDESITKEKTIKSDYF